MINGECRYCGTMYYELHAEGAPCGYVHPKNRDKIVNLYSNHYECQVFTCCTDAWEDHMMKHHPESTEAGHRRVFYFFRWFVFNNFDVF